MNEYEKELQAYKELISYMFKADFNCNDFFGYGCAYGLEVDSYDFRWILECYKKYGTDGIEACLAYIGNMEPIEPHRTEIFNLAIRELMDNGRVVVSDLSYSEDYYKEGPYRTVSKAPHHEEVMTYLKEESERNRKQREQND